MKKRIDILMLERKFVSSRNDAQKLISEGRVKVNGDLVLKNHDKFDENVDIMVDKEGFFVARSGVKLQEAINEFNIDVSGFVCLDVGASTGGFTECLLNNGCSKVYSVDVGTSQLDEKLKKDKRVVNLEKTDIRNLCKLEELMDLIVVDVSFISVLKILPCLNKFLKNSGKIVLLIKPQYEILGDKNKKGKIKDKNLINNIIEGIKKEAEDMDYILLGLIESPILGKKGKNVEFLMYLGR